LFFFSVSYYHKFFEVLLLKVNKEGPLKKDIWRAPGNQAQVRKLSHIMQHGRLVNIANFSVYTAASVIKKFLSKLPGGIFGMENEQVLFNSALHNTDADKQRQVFYRFVLNKVWFQRSVLQMKRFC
ncbi:hypothetical protein ANCCAN_12457, partial [Ancylostoma caninum]